MYNKLPKNFLYQYINFSFFSKPDKDKQDVEKDFSILIKKYIKKNL